MDRERAAVAADAAEVRRLRSASRVPGPEDVLEDVAALQRLRQALTEAQVAHCLPGPRFSPTPQRGIVGGSFPQSLRE